MGVVDQGEQYVSRETSGLHESYLALLLRWTGSVALLSALERHPTAIWRQIEVARAMAPLLPQSGFVDLGSGNGLPAVPLAIENGCPAELIESDRRKAAFLHTVAAHLRLQFSVTASRIEDVTPRKASCVTARALAPLPRLLPLVHRHLAPDGFALLLKGQNVLTEIAAARREWSMDVQHIALDEHSSVLKVSGLQHRLET